MSVVVEGELSDHDGAVLNLLRRIAEPGRGCSGEDGVQLVRQAALKMKGPARSRRR